MTIYLCVTVLLHFQETYNIHIWQYVPLPRNIQHPYMAICSTSKKHTTSIHIWYSGVADSCTLRQTPADSARLLQESCRLCQTSRSPADSARLAGVLQESCRLRQLCRRPAGSRH